MITLLSSLIAPVLTEQALSNISYVGNIMIFCVGLNLIRDRKNPEGCPENQPQGMMDKKNGRRNETAGRWRS